MDQTIVINLGIFVITGIAAIFAGVQAIEARKARSDADTARDEAQTHEASALEAAREAAASSTRSAAAAERQAAAAEKALLDRDPWIFVKAGANRWKVTNRTGGRLQLIDVTSKDDIQLERPDNDELLNNGSFHLTFGGGMTDPASTEIEIEWHDGTKVYGFVHTVP